MDAEISEFYETLERKLGCHIPDFQVLNNRQKGHLNDRRDWIPEFHLPQTEPSEKRISERYSSAESPVSGYVWSNEKVDNKNPELGAGLRRIEYYVWRTITGIVHLLK